MAEAFAPVLQLLSSYPCPSQNGLHGPSHVLTSYGMAATRSSLEARSLVLGGEGYETDSAKSPQLD
eukprot:601489-Hanusia_phi.AAC.8